MKLVKMLVTVVGATLCAGDTLCAKMASGGEWAARFPRKPAM